MNEMAKKEKQTYPRTRKEMLRIMRAADKKGQLLEMVLEEFAKHPFSMPALWNCRDYIFSIKHGPNLVKSRKPFKMLGRQADIVRLMIGTAPAFIRKNAILRNMKSSV